MNPILFIGILVANVLTAEARAMTAPFSKEQLSGNVFRVKYDLKQDKKWEAWALLTSDRHWDNPHSDLKLQKKHLDEAVDRGAAILDCGDFFCCMQGKYDKRASKSAVRKEHQVDNYFDAIVEDAADWFAPYAKNMVFIAVGNHESEVKKRHEIDLIERAAALITSKGKSPVRSGTFSGFCIFNFSNVKKPNNGTTRTITAHYDHGYGGGGPVTDDMIQHQRRAVYLPDADIIMSGHTHGAWTQERERKRVTSQGLIYHDIQTHIKLCTYKDDYGTGSGGWAVEKGHPPKPKGAWWLRFFWDRTKYKVFYEVIRAR